MRRTTGFVRAFSIIEALIVLAVLAIVGAVVVGVASQTTKVAETTKLEQDVAALNTAVRVFKANGGKIANSWKIAKVLEELKTKADAATGPKIAGFRGSMLDPRVEAIDETVEETSSGEPKALWDSVNHRFYLSKAPIRGVRRFALNEAKAETATESRARTVSLALTDGNGWVWPFKDSPSNSRNAPRSPNSAQGVDGGGAGNGNGNPLPSGGPIELNPPLIIGADGGTFNLIDFPKVFAVADANPEGSSTVMVSTDGQSWEEYTGPVNVTPGQTVYSYTESLDDEYWADSEVVIETFNFIKVTPQISLAFDRPSYNFRDLGGAFIGVGTTASGANRGAIALGNPQVFPTDLMNSDSIRVQWTYDGSSPLLGNPATGVPFAGAWVNQQVGLSQALWAGNANSITVSAVAKSLNQTFINNSSVVKRTVPIQRLQLRAPTATFSDSRVTLALATQHGDTPVGTRIVFNAEGQDPGNVGGEPVSGTLYTGGEIYLPENRVLVARAYAPSGFNNWFLVSNMMTIDGSGLSWEDEEQGEEVVSYENGLECGSLGVETSNFIAEPGYGTTGGHSGSYDDDYSTSGVDFFHVKDAALQNLTSVIGDGSTRFKLIVGNAALSPGARVVINSPSVDGAVNSFVGSPTYSSIPLDELPVFSLDGVAGTTALTDLQVHFEKNVVAAGGIVPTTSEAVRKNVLGRNGEWRNGAFTVQAVLVNADGTPAFTTDPSRSAGGVHGVASSGLLWEGVVYLNTGGVAYNANTAWNPGSPSAPCGETEDCCGEDCVTEDGEIGLTAQGGNPAGELFKLETLMPTSDDCTLTFIYKDDKGKGKTHTYANLNFLGNVSNYRAIYVAVKAGQSINWYEYSPEALLLNRTFTSGAINKDISHISFFGKTCEMPCVQVAVPGDSDGSVSSNQPWLLSGYATGVFSNPTGDVGMDTNLLPGVEDSSFRWGSGIGDSQDANAAAFTGNTSITRAGVGERFLLGTFEYHNGSTLAGTDAAEVGFSIDLAFMGGIVKQSFDYSFGLFSTPDDGVNEYANADYMKFNSLQSSDPFGIFGENYRMDLTFGNTSSGGFSAFDEFHVFENTTAYGELWGMIVRF